MAPLLNEEESALDPYVVLGVEPTASEKEIKQAFRKMSLKCHPDRHPGEAAAIQFRQLTVSVDILTDAAKRAFLNGQLEAKRASKARYEKMHKRRQAGVDDLLAREEQAKKARADRVKASAQMEEENRIKEEGRKMREEAQNRAQQASKPQPMPETTSTNSKPPILPIDMTLWLQLPPDPTPTAAESSSQALQAALEARYGPISFLRLKDPAPAKKKPKGKKAILEFAEGNWGGCWACWNDHSGNGPAEKEIVPGMRAKWATVVAGGQVPEWVEWAARRKAESTKAAEAVPTFSFNPSSTSTKPSAGGGAEFESMTLLRMRQLERERLEAQIREEEQGDE